MFAQNQVCKPGKPCFPKFDYRNSIWKRDGHIEWAALTLNDRIGIMTQVMSELLAMQFQLRPCKDDLVKVLTVMNRIGSESSAAEAYKACLDDMGSCLPLAIKLIPLDYNAVDDNSAPVWNEVKFMDMMRKLIQRQRLPHLPFMYAHMICKDCSYHNPRFEKQYAVPHDLSSKLSFVKQYHANVYKQYVQEDSDIEDENVAEQALDSLLERNQVQLPTKKSCIIVISELMHADLRTMLLKGVIGTKESLMSVIFQVLVGLRILQNYMNMIHNDLHTGNVLLHKIDNGNNQNLVHIGYNIAGQDYRVPLHGGFMAILWDFGLSEQVEDLEPEDPRCSEDIQKLLTTIEDEYQGADKEEVMALLNGNVADPLAMIQNLFEEYRTYDLSGVFETYNIM